MVGHLEAVEPYGATAGGCCEAVEAGEERVGVGISGEQQRDLPTVERPGGFGSVNATGANFRRIIDLSNIDNSVASNAPGQSAQPGSPFYGNLAEALGNGEYFPLLFSRDQVEGQAAHRLTLNPGG